MSSNPAISEKVFSKLPSATSLENSMTVQGTLNKLLGGFIVLSLMAAYAWFYPASSPKVLFAILIVNLIIGFIICFRPSTAPALYIPYAGLEGLLLGTISVWVEQKYPGIAINALTFCLAEAAAFFLLYRSGIIKVGAKLRGLIFSATLALVAVYLLDLILPLFGLQSFGFLHDASPLSIGVSVFAVGLAGFNLLLDFDFIDNAASRGLKKEMEWYGAFALTVTMVWMYIETLRLLQKLRK